MTMTVAEQAQQLQSQPQPHRDETRKCHHHRLTEEDKADVLLSHAYRLSLPSKPVQSNFRVLALLFYQQIVDDDQTSSGDGADDDDTTTNNNANCNGKPVSHLPPWVRQEVPSTANSPTRTFIVGTNDEPGFIGGSICAERAAMVQLRFVPYFRVTKLVIATDSLEPIACGMMCREFLLGHGRSVPRDLPVISTGCRCQWCGKQDEEIFGFTSKLCIDGRAEHSVPTLLTTIADLYPYPSPYTRLSAAQSVALGQAYGELDASKTIRVGSIDDDICLDETSKRLLELAILEAKQTFADELTSGDLIHPIQFGAAMLMQDESIVTSHQSSALEYGCTLDAVSQLASHIEHEVTTCGPPLLIVQVDQYGIAHAPFAPARAWLSERGYGDVRLLLHHFADQDQEDLVVDEDAVPDANRLILTQVTVSDLAPNPPTWNTSTTDDEDQ